MNSDLARSTLEGVVAFDHPIGHLMELTKGLNDGSEKAAFEECCGTFLRLQLELIERISAAFPELRQIDPASADK